MLGMQILVKNKNAERFYEIKQTFEGGLLLIGNEVKSLRNGQGSLEGAHVSISKVPEAWLVQSFIPPFQPTNKTVKTHPHRKRKILLTKKEIETISIERKRGSLTVVPIMVYLERNRMRLRIGLCKKKKLFDKRQTLKKKADRKSMKEIF